MSSCVPEIKSAFKDIPMFPMFTYYLYKLSPNNNKWWNSTKKSIIYIIIYTYKF